MLWTYSSCNSSSLRRFFFCFIFSFQFYEGFYLHFELLFFFYLLSDKKSRCDINNFPFERTWRKENQIFLLFSRKPIFVIILLYRCISNKSLSSLVRKSDIIPCHFSSKFFRRVMSCFQYYQTAVAAAFTEFYLCLRSQDRSLSLINL